MNDRHRLSFCEGPLVLATGAPLVKAMGESKKWNVIEMGVHDFHDADYTQVRLQVASFKAEDPLADKARRIAMFCLECINHTSEVRELLKKIDPKAEMKIWS